MSVLLPLAKMWRDGCNTNALKQNNSILKLNFTLNSKALYTHLINMWSVRSPTFFSTSLARTTSFFLGLEMKDRWERGCLVVNVVQMIINDANWRREQEGFGEMEEQLLLSNGSP